MSLIKVLNHYFLIKFLFRNQQDVHGLSVLKKEGTEKVHKAKNNH